MSDMIIFYQIIRKTKSKKGVNGYDFFESFDKLLDSFGGVWYSELFVGREDVQYEFFFCDIDTDECIFVLFLGCRVVCQVLVHDNFLSCLYGLFALATVRTWNEGWCKYPATARVCTLDVNDLLHPFFLPFQKGEGKTHFT